MRVATLFVNSRSAMESSAAGALAARGADVIRHREVSALMASLRRSAFDAAVLEDTDPDLSDWLAMLQVYSVDHIPIVVTGAGGADAICRALQQGADDYAVTCEGSQALAHRVEAQVALRTQRRRCALLQVGGCTLNADTKELAFAGLGTLLTGREFALAWTLFENAGRIVTFNALSMQIWGKPSDIGKRTIEQHVYKLRRKLAPDGAVPCGVRIETVFGIGYRLDEAGVPPAGAAAEASLTGMDICI